jgi:hypothetical protein
MYGILPSRAINRDARSLNVTGQPPVQFGNDA